MTTNKTDLKPGDKYYSKTYGDIRKKPGYLEAMAEAKKKRFAREHPRTKSKGGMANSRATAKKYFKGGMV